MWSLLIVFMGGMTMQIPLDTTMKQAECEKLGWEIVKSINAADIPEDAKVKGFICGRSA